LPFSPAIDFLTAPLPIIGDLAKAFGGLQGGDSSGQPTTVLDLARALPGQAGKPKYTAWQIDHAKLSLKLAKEILDYSPLTLNAPYNQPLGDFRTEAFGGALTPVGQQLQPIDDLMQNNAVPNGVRSFLSDFHPHPEAANSEAEKKADWPKGAV